MTLDWTKLRGCSDGGPLPIRPAIIVGPNGARVVATWDSTPGTSLLHLATFNIYDRAPWTPFGVPVFVRRAA